MNEVQSFLFNPKKLHQGFGFSSTVDLFDFLLGLYFLTEKHCTLYAKVQKLFHFLTEKRTPSMTIDLQTNYQGVNVSDVIVETISSSKEQKNFKKGRWSKAHSYEEMVTPIESFLKSGGLRLAQTFVRNTDGLLLRPIIVFSKRRCRYIQNLKERGHWNFRVW